MRVGEFFVPLSLLFFAYIYFLYVLGWLLDALFLLIYPSSMALPVKKKKKKKFKIESKRWGTTLEISFEVLQEKLKDLFQWPSLNL